MVEHHEIELTVTVSTSEDSGVGEAIEMVEDRKEEICSIPGIEGVYVNE